MHSIDTCMQHTRIAEAALYLIAPRNQIIHPDREVLGLFKACPLPPMNDFQAEQLILAVNVLRIIVIDDCI